MSTALLLFVFPIISLSIYISVVIGLEFTVITPVFLRALLEKSMVYPLAKKKSVAERIMTNTEVIIGICFGASKCIFLADFFFFICIVKYSIMGN